MLGTPDDGLFTSPCNVDSDTDGMNDGWEYYYSTVPQKGQAQLPLDPPNGCMNPIVGDALNDYDKDGASSYLEYVGVGKAAPGKTAGIFNYPPTGDHTNPCVKDTDGDTFIDGYEYWSRFDPEQDFCGITGTPSVDWMAPHVADVTTDNYDKDGLNNQKEYDGADGAVPGTLERTRADSGRLERHGLVGLGLPLPGFDLLR